MPHCILFSSLYLPILLYLFLDQLPKNINIRPHMSTIYLILFISQALIHNATDVLLSHNKYCPTVFSFLLLSFYSDLLAEKFILCIFVFTPPTHQIFLITFKQCSQTSNIVDVLLFDLCIGSFSASSLCSSG